MNISKHNTYDHTHNYLYKSIMELTESIGDTYPNHAKWFYDKFLIGLRNGERGYIVAEEDNELAGVLLYKNTKNERKISTLFVNPAFRKRGVATRLLKEGTKELGAGCIVTVSVRNMFQLKPLLEKNGFKVIRAVKGKYKPDNIEYYFKYEPSRVPKNIREWAMTNNRGR